MKATSAAKTRLTLRVDLGRDRAVGPGKIRLLEAIRDTGSITKAGVALAQAGGSRGGGAALTSFGRRLIDQYRAIEAEAHSATAARLDELEAACKGPKEATPAKAHAAPRRRTIAH